MLCCYNNLHSSRKARSATKDISVDVQDYSQEVSRGNELTVSKHLTGQFSNKEISKIESKFRVKADQAPIQDLIILKMFLYFIITSFCSMDIDWIDTTTSYYVLACS